MSKKQLIIAGIAAAISLTVALVVSPLLPQLADRSSSELAQESDTSASLGITYLPVTPALSAYYDLGVDSGVLVTEVVPGSPMELASVQKGDVILSCNGCKLDEGVSLLGMMRTFQPDDKIVLEVSSEGHRHIVEYCCGCGTPECTCGRSTPEDE
jgi:S1-C subfamily serine protease